MDALFFATVIAVYIIGVLGTFCLFVGLGADLDDPRAPLTVLNWPFALALLLLAAALIFADALVKFILRGGRQ